jgi:hypothetical protein
MTNNNQTETFEQMTDRLRAELEAYEDSEQAAWDESLALYEQEQADWEDERRDLQTSEKYSWVAGGTVQWI